MMLLLLLILKIFFDIGYSLQVDPLKGPPNISNNPACINEIEKVVISTKDADATANWYNEIFGFTKEPSFDTPFGSVTRLKFKNTLTVELIEYEDAEDGVYKPYPGEPNTTAYTGISQYSFRVQNKDRVEQWVTSKGLSVIFNFTNDPLGLYLQMIRDPTTGQLIELLQPLDNSTTKISDWDSNPMGLLGWNQVSSIVDQTFNYNAGVNNAYPNFYKRFNFILPTSQFLNLMSTFESEIGIYGMGNLRMEMINYATSKPNPKLPLDPPKQAFYLGTFGWAWRTNDYEAAMSALLSVPGYPVLYEYTSDKWGGRSFWFRDSTGLLLEIFEPFGAPVPTSVPTSLPTMQSPAPNDTSHAILSSTAIVIIVCACVITIVGIALMIMIHLKSKPAAPRTTPSSMSVRSPIPGIEAGL